MFKVQALDGAYAWCKIHDAYISRKSAAMEDVLKCIGERYPIEGICCYWVISFHGNM